METNKILTTDILDIIFDGRNKAYGAYELRKSYNLRLRKALTGTVAVCLFIFLASFVANKVKTKKTVLLVHDISLENLAQEVKKPELPVIPPPKAEPPKVEISRFTPPKIVVDTDVKDDDQMKEMDQMEKTKISNYSQNGTADDGIVAAPVEASIGKVEPLEKEPDYESIFNVVQIPSEFPGGKEAWQKYLERNLNRDLPVDNGAPVGKYTVVVTFIVDKTGAISNVDAENDPGYGTKNEAIRVIQKGPSWTPAIQNGRKVIYRHKQSISFVVSENP